MSVLVLHLRRHSKNRNSQISPHVLWRGHSRIHQLEQQNQSQCQSSTAGERQYEIAPFTRQNRRIRDFGRIQQAHARAREVARERDLLGSLFEVVEQKTVGCRGAVERGVLDRFRVQLLDFYLLTLERYGQRAFARPCGRVFVSNRRGQLRDLGPELLVGGIDCCAELDDVGMTFAQLLGSLRQLLLKQRQLILDAVDVGVGCDRRKRIKSVVL